jgi:hypothetical protein
MSRSHMYLPTSDCAPDSVHSLSRSNEALVGGRYFDRRRLIVLDDWVRRAIEREHSSKWIESHHR